MSRHFGGAPVRQGDRVKVFMLFIGLAVLALGGLVFVLVSGNQPTQTASNTPSISPQVEVKMLDVLVPIQDIEAGATLEPAMFRRESRPQISVSKGTLKDFEQLKGQYARSLVVKGQPLHENYITAIKPTTALSATIPPGFRAVTIRVDATSSVEGWARPGSIVDIMWNTSVKGVAAVQVIVENAKVISAERQIQQQQQAGAPVPNTVTLLVTLEDAQKISLASTTGTLSLVLRGDNDQTASTGDRTVTLADITGEKGPIGSRKNAGTLEIGGVKYIVHEDGRLEPLTGDSAPSPGE